MLKFAVLAALLLAACTLSDESQTIGSGDMQGWRGASGKPPTRAEYAAMVAACQNGAVQRAQGRPLDACLANLGLKRAE